MPGPSSKKRPGKPFLEHYPEQGGPAERVEVCRVPFTLGRGTSHDRTVYSVGVSRDHAEIARVGGVYTVRDLGSTNGTFVNGVRVEQAHLSDGDIVHLAHVEFCFRYDDRTSAPSAPAPAADVNATMALPTADHDSVIRGSRLIRELIDRAEVRTVYQPIVKLDTRETVAFEALGRGTHVELSDSPAVLLEIARRCQSAAELSRLFRERAIRDTNRLPAGSTIFLNVHPSELENPEFLETLLPMDRHARDAHRFVLEIAESSVTDVKTMVRMREGMLARGYGFAYDDFGAGQARLLELSDVPPDYLKLDRAMIEGIDRIMPRRQLVRALVRVVAESGVRVIAEGIESEEVARTCESLGCHLGQGYLFGH